MTAGVDPEVLYRALTLDARRGGVVLLSEGGAIASSLRGFCDGLAEQGYEVAAIGDGAPEPVARRLSGPVFLLSLGGVGAIAWLTICRDGQPFAAASLSEPPLAALSAGEPQCPTDLHLTANRAAWPAHVDQLCERRSDVRGFPYRASAGFTLGGDDAAHLVRLRTLQLYHRSGGAKGEMGG